MKRLIRTVFIMATASWLISCGQDEVKFPDMETKGGVCGEWYPGDYGSPDAGVDQEEYLEAIFAVEEGAIFPCAVWESARLANEDMFINVGQIYLEAKHGVIESRSIVIVISAEHCPTCSVLISAMAKRVSDFEDAGALMIGMARRNLIASPDNPDFNLEKACEVLEDEGWSKENWYCINDEEDYLPTTFDTAVPWVVVVSVKDMMVHVVSNQIYQPNEKGVQDLLDFLNSATFD